MAITGSPSGGPFVISHGACGRSRVIGNSGRPAPSSLYPARQSAAHPHRYGLGMVRISRTSSAAQDARGRDIALEAEDLQVPRVVFRNIASTRAGSVSTPARLGGTRTRMVAAACWQGSSGSLLFAHRCGSHGVVPIVPSADAPASTNTASTPLARTLRICACDRASCPRAG